MAKKKIVINNQELTPTVLAVKQDKKKSSFLGFLWVVIIFAVLIGCVYYMPQISTYVKQLIMPDVTPIKGSSNKTPTTVDKPSVSTYNFSENLVINFDNIKFSDFKIDNNNLLYNVTTTVSYEIDLTTRNIFIHLYDTNNKELQVSKVITETPLTKDNQDTMIIVLKNTNIAKIMVNEMKQSEYPAYLVNTDSDGLGKLNCSDSYKDLTYYFQNNKLYSISLIEIIKKDANNYDQIISSYNDKYTNYASINGYSIDINESLNETKYIVNIDLNKNDGSMILGSNTFKKDTDASIVKYDLEASGYSCN